LRGCFPPACPVCLGAGRISDRMPVADALADAETLRVVGMNAGPLPTVRWLYVLSWTLPQFPDWKTAHHAARAAFRAVPGLREE